MPPRQPRRSAPPAPGRPAAIDATALPRDRTACAPAALAELQSSNARDGVRQPIEVFALAEPDRSARLNHSSFF